MIDSTQTAMFMTSGLLRSVQRNQQKFSLGGAFIKYSYLKYLPILHRFWVVSFLCISLFSLCTFHAILFRSIQEASSVKVSVPVIRNHKAFTSAYLEAKVRELQPYGSDYLKASKMFESGQAHILSKTLGKFHSTFSVESQSDASRQLKVEISKKSGLSRDIMSQLHFSCSCDHFKRPSVKMCKHLIYCLLCFFVRD